jgi:hypothetical protein
LIVASESELDRAFNPAEATLAGEAAAPSPPEHHHREPAATAEPAAVA